MKLHKNARSRVLEWRQQNLGSLFKRTPKIAENDAVHIHILPHTGKIDKTLAPLPQ